MVFAVTLLVANCVWKITFVGDEGMGSVLWLGMNVTKPFDVMARHISSVVYGIVSLVRHTVYMPRENAIHFLNGNGTTIVWSCTGFKQAWIWICLLLTARGPWIKKLWYIPLGLVCAHLFNIVRIALITLSIEHHPEWFSLLHNYVFKYAFYAVLFGMWVVWIQRLTPPLIIDTENR